MDLVFGTIQELTRPAQCFAQDWPLEYSRDRVKHESMLVTQCLSNRGFYSIKVESLNYSSVFLMQFTTGPLKIFLD